MPSTLRSRENESIHTGDIQDIISAVPFWLVRWGITLFFSLLLLILGMASVIKYPDIIKTQVRIESPNTPKPIVMKMSAKLVRLLVKEGERVQNGEALAYIESTANHSKVIGLLNELYLIQKDVQTNKNLGSSLKNWNRNAELGELQGAYQVFFQDYLDYKSAVENGFYLKKRSFLENDLKYLRRQEKQLDIQKSIQQRDLALAGDEFQIHKKLADAKVETVNELRQQESKFLSKRSPVVQTESELITASSNYSAKEKEILELENQITEEKAKFHQALNSFISEVEDWKSKYVLSASQSGKLVYVGILQENQVFKTGDEVFYINPGNDQYFGRMYIQQNNMGKIKTGQAVLIKLRSYPFEEYGILKGRIIYIADVPFNDSTYVSKVKLNVTGTSDQHRPIHLKQGMIGDAEIVTQDATILQRLSRSFFRMVVKE